MRIQKLILIVIFGVALLAANDKDSSFTSAKFLVSGIAGGSGELKDAGTSPLSYKGLTAILPFAYISENSKESFDLGMNIGYLAGSAASNYNLQLFSGEVYFGYLRNIEIFKRPDLLFQAGGHLSAAVTGSINPSLQNATLNMDYFTALSASAQLQYLFERPAINKKIAFIKIRKPHRKYAIHFRMDLPLLMFNGRPTFPYVIEDDNDIFNRNYFLGGFQLKTDLGIKRYLPNGNALELAYLWEMYTSGNKDIYLLERASHNIQFSFYFKLN
ncbi:MAG: hypothetical protein K9N05_04050 [Candidatus Marinimicrobia bacterium]|nr:hypothetical protein [Candidatus Neomarinimicrobiota bacterium]